MDELLHPRRQRLLTKTVTLARDLRHNQRQSLRLHPNAQHSGIHSLQTNSKVRT